LAALRTKRLDLPLFRQQDPDGLAQVCADAEKMRGIAT
jgi:hypothetical protein